MARVKITEAAFGADADGFAKVLDGASVQVNVSGGGAATVYVAATGGTTLSNPLTSDNGRVPGYVAEGSYDLVVTYEAVTADAVPFEARAAYPAGGTSGQVLTSDGAGSAAWSAPTAITAGLPWKIDLNVVGPSITQTGWATVSQNSAYIMGSILSTDNANIDNEVGWDVVLAAGTWTFNTYCLVNSDYGICTVSLDGASIGDIDMYNASGSFNNSKSLTGVAVAATGKKRLLLKMHTKNASSTGYKAALHFISLLRTA